MRKLYRSLLAVGALATLAACGDDVSITEPPETVTISGAPVTAIKVGDVVQLSANVAVTWSTSAQSVASVDANSGLVTAVSAGIASITATSTTDQTKKASVTITVSGSIAPSVSIFAVNGFLTGLPVNPNAVAGQVNVVVNMDPGDFTVQSLELLLDGNVVDQQDFAAAATASAVEGEANAVQQVTFALNTAEFNATTGVARFMNGAHALSARVVVTGGGSAGSAAPTKTLVFANANTWVATIAYTGTTANAIGTQGAAAGLSYNRGGLDVTVLPVIYNVGQSIVAAGSVVRFGSACDASGTGQRNVTLSGNPLKASFPQTSGGSVAAVNSVSNYEFSAALCPAVNGEVPTLTAVDNSGNTVFTNVPPVATTGIRLDNRAPGAPTFMANPNGRNNGWINAAVTIGNNTSLTSNAWLVNGTPDAGIGGGSTSGSAYQRFIRIGDGSAGTNAAANAATAENTLTTPAPTLASTSLCAVITARDELGNESARPSNGGTCAAAPTAPNTAVAAQSMRFGVDIAPPTIAYDVSSLAADARVNGGSIAGSFVVTVADTGAIGNSGMLAGTPVIANVIRRTAAGTSFSPAPGDCLVGTLTSSGTVCSKSGNGLPDPQAPPLVPTLAAAVANQSVAGYYTYDATAVDAAGNSTVIPAGARVIVYDNTMATATAPAVPVTITGAFNAAAFLNDNLSIRDYYWTSEYTTALISPVTITLAAAPTPVDAFNAATLSTTNVGINTNINTFLGLQDGTTVPPTAYAGGAHPLSAVNLFVRDQTQAAYSGPFGAAVAPTAPTTGVSVTNFTGAYTNATNAASLCALAAASGGCTVGAPTPASATWTATATGATAVFNNPFSRVDFYASNGADLVLVGSVPAGSATLVDNGATRVWTYSMTVQANALFTLLGGVSGGAPGAAVNTTFYAFGANAAGNVALVSAGVAQTINP